MNDRSYLFTIKISFWLKFIFEQNELSFNKLLTNKYLWMFINLLIRKIPELFLYLPVLCCYRLYRISCALGVNHAFYKGNTSPQSPQHNSRIRVINDTKVIKLMKKFFNIRMLVVIGKKTPKVNTNPILKPKTYNPPILMTTNHLYCLIQ